MTVDIVSSLRLMFSVSAHIDHDAGAASSSLTKAVVAFLSGSLLSFAILGGAMSMASAGVMSLDMLRERAGQALTALYASSTTPADCTLRRVDGEPSGFAARCLVRGSEPDFWLAATEGGEVTVLIPLSAGAARLAPTAGAAVPPENDAAFARIGSLARDRQDATRERVMAAFD